jgi:hypothetical protein
VTVVTLTSKGAIVRTLRELADYYEAGLVIGFSFDHSSPTGVARFTWILAPGKAIDLAIPGIEREADEDDA